MITKNVANEITIRVFAERVAHLEQFLAHTPCPYGCGIEEVEQDGTPIHTEKKQECEWCKKKTYFCKNEMR
jgi:hypothetical protein